MNFRPRDAFSVTIDSVSGKTAHDARLLAVMIKHGIDRLPTFNDADFKRYAEITAESPLGLETP